MPNEGKIYIESINQNFANAIRVWSTYLENPTPANWTYRTYAAERFFVDQLKLDRPPLWAPDINMTRIVEKAFSAIGMFNAGWKNDPASLTSRAIRQLQYDIKIAEQYTGISIDAGEALNFERGGKPRQVPTYDSIDVILQKAQNARAADGNEYTPPPAPKYDYLELKPTYGKLELRSQYEQTDDPLGGLAGLGDLPQPGSGVDPVTPSGTGTPIPDEPGGGIGTRGEPGEPKDPDDPARDPARDAPAEGL